MSFKNGGSFFHQGELELSDYYMIWFVATNQIKLATILILTQTIAEKMVI